MADPFEVRMRFTTQLQHLNASASSATKAANYALRYAEFSEDLHSCILEQLERSNMNNRANIMYFLPSLCNAAKAQNELGYVRMMERDILRIIDLVAPDDDSGPANVKVVRKVLQNLQQKQFLQPQTVTELEECLAGRDNTLLPSPPHLTPPPEEQDGVPAPVRSTPQSTARDSFSNASMRLDKRQIEQRIEEDRERHKRAREGIWAVVQENIHDIAKDAEFDMVWEEVSEIDEDDYKYAREQLDERRKCMQYEDCW